MAGVSLRRSWSPTSLGSLWASWLAIDKPDLMGGAPALGERLAAALPDVEFHIVDGGHAP